MATYLLILVWAGLGLLVGLLGLAARLPFFGTPKYRWLVLCALAVGAALLGGGLGFWLLGRLFASACSLWIAVVAICLPGLYRALSRFFAQAWVK